MGISVNETGEVLRAFGENIKKFKQQKKLSYRKMAQMCEIDYSDLQKYAGGKKNITLITIAELAKGLGVRPKDLIDF